ncbi:phage tail assembly chaperone G, partial [Staphylococcus aureus]|uniref:phage tail assembly chaperone G n=1 Tax=Staphylococcus aureus TaxID=1280 RepID=UPI00351DB765
GIGGGIIIVPTMVYLGVEHGLLHNITTQVAIGTSSVILIVTEQEEYKNKQEEYENNMAVQMEVLEEVLDFIVEAFDNQCTSIELQKGLPNGQEGIEKIGQLIGRITGGEPSATKKFVTENQK